jgi:hypothetical protein
VCPRIRTPWRICWNRTGKANRFDRASRRIQPPWD